MRGHYPIAHVVKLNVARSAEVRTSSGNLVRSLVNLSPVLPNKIVFRSLTLLLVTTFISKTISIAYILSESERNGFRFKFFLHIFAGPEDVEENYTIHFVKYKKKNIVSKNLLLSRNLMFWFIFRSCNPYLIGNKQLRDLDESLPHIFFNYFKYQNSYEI